MQLDAFNLAVLVLTTLVGISLVNVLANSFLRFFISIVVLAFVFITLVHGQSDFIETLTFHLGRYFANEPFGLAGVVLGVLIGAALRKRR